MQQNVNYVTGIMAGVNLSGDLRDPIGAIPTGIAAVGKGCVFYED